MNDQTLRTAYSKLLEQRDRHAGECVAPEALLAVADGTALEADRLRTLKHVGGCARCRADLDLLRTAIDTAERMARPQWRSTPILAAAASVLLVVSVTVWQMTRQPPADSVRSVAPAAVQLVGPPEDVAAELPVTLVWHAVASARRYDVEILDASGGAVFATTTADTTIIVPGGTLVPGVDYRWWVRALVPGETLPSLTRRLRIVTP